MADGTECASCGEPCATISINGKDLCEECFKNLTVVQLSALLDISVNEVIALLWKHLDMGNASLLELSAYYGLELQALKNEIAKTE